ncbi:MAG: hypothetical protein MUP70_05135, partial [Candidatus Aminicenantes bacterium]|nr:hypothetical protein [Candidatus Aminicenantes bacterium]
MGEEIEKTPCKKQRGLSAKSQISAYFLTAQAAHVPQASGSFFPLVYFSGSFVNFSLQSSQQ